MLNITKLGYIESKVGNNVPYLFRSVVWLFISVTWLFIILWVFLNITYILGNFSGRKGSKEFGFGGRSSSNGLCLGMPSYGIVSNKEDISCGRVMLT